MVKQLNSISDDERSVFSENYTLMALRDSRYHNTAYAIAELIDNSVEANAGNIELLCHQESKFINTRNRKRLTKIAVLDNGEGMNSSELLAALRFGGGTRHKSTRGIGKYGMGLPTASMSQCKRVDVWTWQDGPESVLHSVLDIDDIVEENYLLPLPESEQPIPEVWKQIGDSEIFAHKSGTLVVWSKLDKIAWKVGEALIRHTEAEIGRIHRHFIFQNIVKIRAKCFMQTQPREPDTNRLIRPNDPLYLMAPSATPEEPWNEEAMFDQWVERHYTNEVDGRDTTITVTYSIVKKEALDTGESSRNPGSTDRGKHARSNIGVSVVREDREIVLESAFVREGGGDVNPLNRWWGCEVQFFRNCDELFGVDHNKQMVANFSQAVKALSRDDRNLQLIKDELGIDDDDIIFQIVGDIRSQTRAMREHVRQMFESRKPGGRRPAHVVDPETDATKTATDADQEAIDAGEETPTKTDEAREIETPQERTTGLTEQFIDGGQTEQDARELAQKIVEEGLHYQFNSTQLDGFLMFNVRSKHGVLHINLNTDHPIYEHIKHVESKLEESADDSDPVYVASLGLRLLLTAWARMEDQTEAKAERTQIQEISNQWGKQVDKVLSRLQNWEIT